jgi:mono/diheme cytochrome c family protein
VEVDPSVAEGPLPSPEDPVDATLADAGEAIFGRQCLACHRLEGPELVGPNLGDVASRRGFDWIRGMVLSPDSMLRVDAQAQALLDRYKVPMTDTGLDEARFRAVLAFLRRSAGQGEEGPAG